MDNEELKALIAPAAVEESEPAPAPAPEPEQPVEGPARGPDGKFTAKADEPDAEPPLNKTELAGTLHALLTEREKRQAAERERDEWKAKVAPPAEPTPDQAMAQQVRAVTLNTSRKFAEKEYGKDLVAAVHDWASARCDADPAFNAEMFSVNDPYEHAVQAYNRAQIAETVKSPDDLAQFKAWKASFAKASEAPPTTEPILRSLGEAGPIPPPPDAPVPRSLATAPGNGAAGKPHIPVGEGQAYASVIK